MENGAHHVIGSVRFTHVRRAGSQRFRPKFVVGEPMRANDAQAGKLAMQGSHVIQSRTLQIEDEDLRSMPGDGGTNLI